jgi:hypothetical protein
MRVQFPIATGTCYHVMSLDITQCHDLTVPKLSKSPLSQRAAHDPELTITRVRNGACICTTLTNRQAGYR